MKRDLLAILPALRDGARLPDGLVSCPQGRWTAILANRATTPAWRPLLRRQRLSQAAERQRMLEALMPLGPVLAALPGTALTTEEAANLIVANTPLLERLAENARGKVQFQVSISWQADRVLDRFRGEPELASLFKSDQVTSAALIAGVTRLSDRLRAQAMGRLGRVACALTELPREQDMLANAVLLIEDRDEPALDAALEQIDSIWSDGLHIRQIGPGPAMSFNALDVREIDGAQLADARRCLDLPQTAAPDDIDAARQQKLRRPGAPVDEIRSAAQVLTALSRLAPGTNRLHLAVPWSEPGAEMAQMEDVA